MAYSEMKIVAKTNKAHVNNVLLFEYLDQARQDWYRFSIKTGVESVVVHAGVSYKKEVFNHNQLLIQTTLDRIGNTSYTLKQNMINHLNELVVTAEVVLTTINRQTRMKVNVPEAFHTLLKENINLNTSQIPNILSIKE
ncbi:acyl-CoA thioesterase [Mesobacillus maritimus]|uniref:acyl-CoA thioesterase n=1 Tax=Mesobacillus maritimus TaxID=1643336 RepID=UPI002041BD14|nr:acyl-CoA thioesterase [Mesobacillus maritimus]MCM3584194.1 acyl-CoA thioesterase [Mesobacillus maritimus]MCM3669344.1 acyl-CoA thioesterase [Mesobacillus maritimus]